MVAVQHPFEPRGHRREPAPTRSCPAEATPEDRRLPAALAALVVAVLLVAGGPAADAAAGLVGGRRQAVAEVTTAPEPEVVSPAGRPSVHRVRAGETYWSIAEGLGDGGDIRATVDALMAANDGRVLQAGGGLVLPG